MFSLKEENPNVIIEIIRINLIFHDIKDGQWTM